MDCTLLCVAHLSFLVNKWIRHSTRLFSLFTFSDAGLYLPVRLPIAFQAIIEPSKAAVKVLIGSLELLSKSPINSVDVVCLGLVGAYFPSGKVLLHVLFSGLHNLLQFQTNLTANRVGSFQRFDLNRAPREKYV